MAIPVRHKLRDYIVFSIFFVREAGDRHDAEQA